MDFLTFAAVAVPFVALGAVLAEIVVKEPSALAAFLQGSEIFARAPLAARPETRLELFPANDRTKLAA